MHISFHTDAFNTSFKSFDFALEWARANRVRHIECGVIDGASWIQGLGYQPHLPLYADPMELRKKMETFGVRFSQVDAAYPLSDRDGAWIGVPYVLKSIPWAFLAGAPFIATTDGLHKPEYYDDKTAMARMKDSYCRILEVAQNYGLGINIELHGYFTTKLDYLQEMLDFVDSPLLGVNFDTGNTFIAGNDPVEFLKPIIGKVRHVHVKDVSESLAASLRGADTGIALSHCAIGDGVNAENIKSCLTLLRDNGYEGTLSMECEGAGGPMIERSLSWLRGVLDSMDIPRED